MPLFCQEEKENILHITLVTIFLQIFSCVCRWPLWAKISPENGGWGWTQDWVGLVVLTGIIPTIIWTLYAVPWLFKRYGMENTFVWTCPIVACSFFLMPAIVCIFHFFI